MSARLPALRLDMSVPLPYFLDRHKCSASLPLSPRQCVGTGSLSEAATPEIPVASSSEHRHLASPLSHSPLALACLSYGIANHMDRSHLLLLCTS